MVWFDLVWFGLAILPGGCENTILTRSLSSLNFLARNTFRLYRVFQSVLYVPVHNNIVIYVPVHNNIVLYVPVHNNIVLYVPVHNNIVLYVPVHNNIVLYVPAYNNIVL